MAHKAENMKFLTDINKETNMVDSKCFKKEIHRFENREFIIPSGYDEILRNYYGEYMKLPPKNQRISNHYFSAYRK